MTDAAAEVRKLTSVTAGTSRRLGCAGMATSHLSPRGRILLLAALAAFAVAILFATGFDLDLMMVLPALATAALLLAWPHPGIDLILRIAVRCRSPRPGRARGVDRPHLSTVTRGGRLIAVSLGGRAPPAPAFRV